MGCYNKIPQTGWLINNQCLLLIVLETWCQKICLMRACFFVHRQPAIFSLCPHITGGGRELSRVPYKGNNSFYEGSILMIQSTPKGPTVFYNHIGHQVSVYEWRDRGGHLSLLQPNRANCSNFKKFIKLVVSLQLTHIFLKHTEYPHEFAKIFVKPTKYSLGILIEIGINTVSRD